MKYVILIFLLSSYFLIAENDVSQSVSVIKERCHSCHGKDKVKGSFDLTTMLNKGLHLEDVEGWSKVYRVIKAGDMPPEDEEEPLTLGQEDLVLNTLSKKLVSRKNVVRLLTADELMNTLADVFEIDLENDNQLESIKGFSSNENYSTLNGEESMSIFYLNEINRLLDSIYQDYIVLNDENTFKVEVGKKTNLRLNNVGFASRSLIYETNEYTDLRGRYSAHATALRPDGGRNLNFAPGKYLLKINVSAHQSEKIKNVPEKVNNHLRLLHEEAKLNVLLMPKYKRTRPDSLGVEKLVKSYYLKENSNEELVVELDLKTHTAIGIEYENGPFSNHIKGIEKGYDKKNETTSDKYEFPYLRFHKMEIEKVYEKERILEYIKGEKDIQQALLGFAKELNYFLGTKFNEEGHKDLISHELNQNKDTESIFLSLLKSVFLSPEFNYIGSIKSSKDDRFVSYSLLKSSPSDTFIKKYGNFKSKKESALEFSEWLIQQKSFDRFITQFTHEWLSLSEIEMNLPDEVTFQKFYTNHLKSSFSNEAVAYVKNLFLENRPVYEIIDSDYSFLNNNLREFYGLELADHDRLEKVKFAGGHRGGVIMQGAFMSATANGVEALPFKRAKWISENILNRKIPAPPDNIEVEAFEETEGTFAEKMIAHTKNLQCASCHKHLDGWAGKMRYFDAIGEIEEHFNEAKKLNELLVMKESLLRKKKATAEALCLNLISFMTGRKTDVSDYENVELIIDQVKSSDYRVRDIYSEIVKVYF